MARLAERLPVGLIDTLREQWDMLARLDLQIEQIEQRSQAWIRQDRASRLIAEIPGGGLLTATAAVATMGDAKAFQSRHEFAAWLGLVPAQTGTGGREACDTDQGDCAGGHWVSRCESFLDNSAYQIITVRQKNGYEADFCLPFRWAGA